VKGFLDGLIRFRVIILAAIVLVTGFLGYEATRIQLNTDFSTYLAADDPLVEDFNRVGEVFGTNYVGMVLINTDVFTPEWLDSIKILTQRYEKVDGVVGVTSLYSLSQMALDGRRLLPPYPEAPSQIEPFKEAVMRQAFLKGLVVSDSGSAALILVNFDPNADHSQVAKALEDITNSVVPNPDLVYFGGMPFRCDMDGSNFEVLAHNFRNNYEVTVDGQRFLMIEEDAALRGPDRLHLVLDFARELEAEAPGGR